MVTSVLCGGRWPEGSGARDGATPISVLLWSLIIFVPIFFVLCAKLRIFVYIKMLLGMKRIFLIVAILFLSTPLYAQKEPEFIGEVIAIGAKNAEDVLLSKEMAVSKVSSSVNVCDFFCVLGTSSSRALFELNGGFSATQFDVEDPLKFIVRSVDNNLDPMAYVKIIRMQSDKLKRSTITTQSSSMYVSTSSYANASGTTTTNNSSLVPFSAKKYGANSYLITIESQEPGEYVVATANPNDINKLSLVFSTFGLQRGYHARLEFLKNKDNPEYVQLVFDKLMNYLIENNLRPELFTYSTGSRLFDIFSLTYVDSVDFENCFGCDFCCKLLREYPAAKKEARRKAKAERKLRKGK